MNDRTEAALREALQERGEQIAPTPALPGILHRATRARAPRRRWLPIGVAALASAGLVTAGVLVFAPGPSEEPDRQPAASNPPSGTVATPGPVTVEPGTVVPMALHFVSDYQGGTLVSGEFEITSSGDLGVDAVQALIDMNAPDAFGNGWWWLEQDPQNGVTGVRAVTMTDDLVTVDFDGPVAFEWCPPEANCAFPKAELTLQQLVQTLQSTLRTDAPVLVTIDGEPADEAFDVPIDGPIAADPSVAPGIRLESPGHQATVTSPVTVTGRSTSFEGNVQWEAVRDGEVVDEGYTMGGSMGEFAPFEVSIDLEPGDYTITLWEANAAGGSEGLAPRLSPVYLDITVE